MTLDLTEIARLITACPLELLAIALAVPLLIFVDHCYADADEHDAPYEA